MTSKTKMAEPRTAAIVSAEIAELDAADAPRVDALATDEAARPGLIEAGDVDAIEALDARIRRARIEGEVSAARRAKLVAEHGELAAAERYAADQAERAAEHTAALDAREEARRLYAIEYPRLAAELAALLSRVSAIGAQVAAANARRPDGRGLIPLDFEPNRGRPEVRGKVRTAKRQEYYDIRTGKTLTAYRHGDPNLGSRLVDYETEDMPTPAVPHVPLAAVVSLPGLAFGDDPFWRPHPAHLAPPPGSAFTDYRQVSQAPAYQRTPGRS